MLTVRGIFVAAIDEIKSTYRCYLTSPLPFLPHPSPELGRRTRERSDNRVDFYLGRPRARRRGRDPVGRALHRLRDRIYRTARPTRFLRSRRVGFSAARKGFVDAASERASEPYVRVFASLYENFGARSTRAARVPLDRSGGGTRVTRLDVLRVSERRRAQWLPSRWLFGVKPDSRRESPSDSPTKSSCPRLQPSCIGRLCPAYPQFPVLRVGVSGAGAIRPLSLSVGFIRPVRKMDNESSAIRPTLNSSRVSGIVNPSRGNRPNDRSANPSAYPARTGFGASIAIIAKRADHCANFTRTIRNFRHASIRIDF